jgi:hypothetical protein
MSNQEYNVSHQISIGMRAVMSILVLPIALVSLVFVAWRGIKNKNFVEGLPLFLIQLNSVYIWTCELFLQIGWYRYQNCY